MEGKLKKVRFHLEHFLALLALKWYDQREVWLFSTMHEPEIVDVGDKSDVIPSTIGSIRKSAKWYIKLFFHLMDMALYNSFGLYKLRVKNPFSNFQLELIREMLEKKNWRKTIFWCFTSPSYQKTFS